MFRSDDPIARLEDELRLGRPTLDRSVQRSIARRVQPGHGPVRRAALALVLTTSTLGAMSAMGGIGFAFSTVSHSFGSNSQSNSLKGFGNSWGNYNGYGGSSSGSCYKNYPPKPPKKHCPPKHNKGGYGDYGTKGGGFGFGW
jgi:hypothetical protein